MKKELIVLIMVLTVLPIPSYAYIDPATGSFILQMIVAGITGFFLFFRIYFSKIKNLWNRMTSKEKAQISE